VPAIIINLEPRSHLVIIYILSLSITDFNLNPFDTSKQQFTMSSSARISNARNPLVRRRPSTSTGGAMMPARPGRPSPPPPLTPRPGPRPVLLPEAKLSPSTPFLEYRSCLCFVHFALLTTCSSLGSQMVDIYVGPDEMLFRVHKTKLCKITYFNKLFNSGFREAAENTAKFPEDDCEAFDILVEWVYDPSLRRFEDRKPGTATKAVTRPDSCWKLLDLYALAEKYCIPKLQDLALDIIRREHKAENRLPSTQYVRQAYEKTSAGSPLSRYALSAIYYIIDCSYSESDWPTSEVEKLFQELPSFASDYIKLQRSTSPIDPRYGPIIQSDTHRGDETSFTGAKKQIRIDGTK
jgi:hypothetical protein